MCPILEERPLRRLRTGCARFAKRKTAKNTGLPVTFGPRRCAETPRKNSQTRRSIQRCNGRHLYASRLAHSCAQRRFAAATKLPIRREVGRLERRHTRV